MVKSTKSKDLLNYFILIAVVILVNIISSKEFFRIDLTEEKRYSISEASKKELGKIKEDLFIEIYLEGDLPAGFKRLQTSIKEQLDEFNVYANNKIVYRFLDPSTKPEGKVRTEFYYSLVQKGIQPTNLYDEKDGKKTEKLLFPGAVVRHKGKEAGVLLLKGSQTESPEEGLNQSIEGLEYELINTIRSLTNTNRKKIAYLRGNGQLDSLYIADLVGTLNQFYEVRPVNLNKIPNLAGYDAIIMAKPTITFSEDEKVKIDQFIVSGGKALFFIDPLNISIDSLRSVGAIPLPYNLGLDELFFNYGFRVNNDLIQDIQSGYVPVNVGMMGNQPQIKLLPWRYYPLMNNFAKHPIVKNMDAVYTKFVSSIDTIYNPKIKKTPIMMSSKYSQKFGGMRQVSFNEIRIEPKPDQFKNSFLISALLLEGRFTSAFAGLPFYEEKYPGIIKQGNLSKIFICSDGDVLSNSFNVQTGQVYPMGYDPFMRRKFANKDLVMNAINYVLDEEGLLNVRLKEIKLRPLDKYRIEAQKKTIQTRNIVIPVVVIILLGILKAFWRKRKYANFK